MTKSKADIITPLNIADTFTLAMAEEIRQDGLSGSLCGFALELNQTPDLETLKQRIDQFSHQFPTALASLQQRGKRFSWCKRDNAPQLFFQHHCPDEQAYELFQQQTINQLINQKQSRESITAIEFHLMSHHSKATFFIRWILRAIFLMVPGKSAGTFLFSSLYRILTSISSACSLISWHLCLLDSS